MKTRTWLLCGLLAAANAVFSQETPLPFLNEYPASVSVKLSIAPRAMPDPAAAPLQDSGELPGGQFQTLLDGLVRTELGGAGVTMAVWIPGQDLWKGAAGYAVRGSKVRKDENGQTIRDEYGLPALEGAVRMRQDDTLHVASCSKILTAALIVNLVDEGKLNLEDTLESVLPGTKIPNAEQITLRQMLSHTSGIFNYTSDANDFPRMTFDLTRIFTPWEVLKAVEGHGASFLPGQKGRYEYSNTNFLLLGMIVEKTAGESLPVYIQKKLFDPAGLSHTYFALDPTHPCTTANGYTGTSWSPANPSVAFAGGNVVSTAEEYAKLVHFILAGDFLRPESLREFTTPVLQNYAFGVGVQASPARIPGPVYSHTGGYIGFSSQYLFHKATGVTAMVILNQASFPSGQTAFNKEYQAFETAVQLARRSTAVTAWEEYEAAGR